MDNTTTVIEIAHVSNKVAEQNETWSPFDVKGVKTNITREEIIEAIHEGRGNDRW